MPPRLARAPTRRIVLAAALLALAAGAGNAQEAPRRGVRLEVRPRPGDTIRTRLDQTVEMTGTVLRAAADGEPQSSKTVVTTLVVFGRVVPERRDGPGTRVLAITDSLDVHSTGGRAAIDEEALRRALVGRHMHLLLSPDGSTRVIEQPLETSRALRALVAQMPPTLPNHVVRVGDAWQQVMAIPVAGDPTGTQAGELTTTFRLDSLSREGRVAWVSLRGAITRDSSATPLPPGATYSMIGEVTGYVQVDRRLGWITESRATIVIRSMLTPPPDSADPTMRFVMRVTQRLQAIR